MKVRRHRYHRLTCAYEFGVIDKYILQLLTLSELCHFLHQKTFKVHILDTQLLLRFCMNYYKTWHASSSWSVDVHLTLGLSSNYLNNCSWLTNFVIFQLQKTFRVHILCAQLLLQFFMCHSEHSFFDVFLASKWSDYTVLIVPHGLFVDLHVT